MGGSLDGEDFRLDLSRICAMQLEDMLKSHGPGDPDVKELYKKCKTLLEDGEQKASAAIDVGNIPEFDKITEVTKALTLACRGYDKLQGKKSEPSILRSSSSLKISEPNLRKSSSRLTLSGKPDGDVRKKKKKGKKIKGQVADDDPPKEFARSVSQVFKSKGSLRRSKSDWDEGFDSGDDNDLPLFGNTDGDPFESFGSPNIATESASKLIVTINKVTGLGSKRAGRQFSIEVSLPGTKINALGTELTKSDSDGVCAWNKKLVLKLRGEDAKTCELNLMDATGTSLASVSLPLHTVSDSNEESDFILIASDSKLRKQDLTLYASLSLKSKSSAKGLDSATKSDAQNKRGSQAKRDSQRKREASPKLEKGASFEEEALDPETVKRETAPSLTQISESELTNLREENARLTQHLANLENEANEQSRRAEEGQGFLHARLEAARLYNQNLVNLLAEANNRVNMLLPLQDQVSNMEQRIHAFENELAQKKTALQDKNMKLKETNKALQTLDDNLEEKEKLLRDTRFRLFWEKKRGAVLCDDLDNVQKVTETMRDKLAQARYDSRNAERQLLQADHVLRLALPNVERCKILARTDFCDKKAIQNRITDRSRTGIQIDSLASETESSDNYSDDTDSSSDHSANEKNRKQRKNKTTNYRDTVYRHHRYALPAIESGPRRCFYPSTLEEWERAPRLSNQFYKKHPESVYRRPIDEKMAICDLYKQVIVQDKGLIFEDDMIKVFWKFVGKTLQGNFYIRIVKKYHGNLETISVALEREIIQGALVRLKENRKDVTSAPYSQFDYMGEICVSDPFIDPPIVTITYILTDNTAQTLALRLPIMSVTFCEPCPSRGLETFFNVWNQKDMQGDKYPAFKCQLNPKFLRLGGYEKLKNIVSFGGKLLLIHAADVSPSSVVASGFFPSKYDDPIPILIRLEVQADTQPPLCRVELRSSSFFLAESFQNILLHLLTPSPHF